MVFELVGGTVAIALVKIASSSGALQLGDLLNTEKAFTVILGIFLSVAIAFFFGVIVQYLSRILFSFNYKKSSKYFIGSVRRFSGHFHHLLYADKGTEDKFFYDG